MDPSIPQEKRLNEKGYILPEKIIVEEVLNNLDFKYSPYKNHNPILVHKDCIYYYKVNNHYHSPDTRHVIDMWLYKFDLAKKNRTTKKLNRNPFREELCRGAWKDIKSEMYITHLSFITHYPDLNIT